MMMMMSPWGRCNDDDDIDVTVRVTGTWECCRWSQKPVDRFRGTQKHILCHQTWCRGDLSHSCGGEVTRVSPLAFRILTWSEVTRVSPLAFTVLTWSEIARVSLLAFTILTWSEIARVSLLAFTILTWSDCKSKPSCFYSSDLVRDCKSSCWLDQDGCWNGSEQKVNFVFQTTAMLYAHNHGH